MRFQAILILTLASSLLGQEPNPVQKPGSAEQTPSSRSPIYRVNVVARTTKAVNYRDRQRPTKVDFAGTVLLPESEGEARVQSKKGATQIHAEFEGMEPPERFGRQYLTYVLWAVTPDGRASNLGQIVANGKNKAKLEVTTELQTFALLVTAEPYFAVTQPSDVVVMENQVRPDTIGSTETVDAKFELLRRGSYEFDVDRAEAAAARDDRKVSLDEYEAILELYQAKNAVQLARASRAEEFAPEIQRKAEQQLSVAESRYSGGGDFKTVVALARQATQTAEDARLVALRRQSNQIGANRPEFGSPADDPTTTAEATGLTSR
jgi:hypothetical protein